MIATIAEMVRLLFRSFYVKETSSVHFVFAKVTSKMREGDKKSI